MRARLALTAIAAPAVIVATAPAPSAATAATAPAIPFDAYIAGGDASCLELTLNIGGYSFVVEPDVRMPRATSTISEGQSSALAAAIDPGDSVDALAGLTIPREEGQLAGGIDSGSASIPIPIPGDPGNQVVQALNPINPSLEYPIEHASASYPKAGSTADQESTYLGASNIAAADPTGLLSLDGTVGDAKAGAQSATADAGAGSAFSVSLLGLNVGRFAAHSQSQVGATSVSEDESCTLGDVNFSPPGTGFSLHIGSLTAKLHSERTIAGHKATSTPSLQVSGMSVTQTRGGKSTTTELSPAGNTITVPPSLRSVALPQLSQLPLPLPLPVPASIQTVGLTGTSTSSALSSASNEVTSSMSAATLTMQTTAPVPTQIPTGPPACLTNPQEIAQCLPSLVPSGSGLPITSAPATYTLQLASLDSRAYGFILPSAASGGFTIPRGVPSSASGIGAAGSAASGTGTPGSPGTKPVSATVNVAGTSATIRWTVVALAALLEALLLAALFFRRRSAARGGNPGAPPDSFVDMP